MTLRENVLPSEMVEAGAPRGAALARFAGLSIVLMGVAILAVSFSGWSPVPEAKLSPLQVGRYAVRAERQSADYDAKAERQIAFATDSDNAATSERELAAKEEKRARESAYLAADVKSRIDKILEAGRDQVGWGVAVKGDRTGCWLRSCAQFPGTFARLGYRPKSAQT